MKSLLTLLAAGFLLHGQNQIQDQNQGVAADWEISQTVEALSTQAKRLKPILDQLTPAEWVSKGAPQAYVGQWKGAEDELGYLIRSANGLEKQPERLTLALDTYFRLQSLQTRLDSIADGVRRYQNPAVGDLLVSVLAANDSNRDKLREYITELAETQEEEFKVADQEAQRCRGFANQQTPRQTPPKPAPKRSPKK